MTEQSVRSEAVVTLGKKLVTELKLGDSVDTLGRWMAHYVAELMEEVEDATDEDRSAKQVQLRDAILALWAHRFELPNGARPFGEFEPILRALASLDPESGALRYFSLARAPDNEGCESEETRQWIELAKSLDYTSKILIDHCLIAAANSALDKSKEWVDLAKQAGIDDSFDFIAIRFIDDQSSLMNEQSNTAYQRRILTDRYRNLEAFTSFAAALMEDIKERLDGLQHIDSESK